MPAKHTTSLRKRRPFALAAVLLLALLLGGFPLWWGLPAYDSWDNDEIAPKQVLQAWRWPAERPPLQRHLLRALFVPAEAAAAVGVVPGGWRGFYDLAFLLGRCLSLALCVASVNLVYLSGRELYDRTAALAAAAIFAAFPAVAFYAKTVNLEMPYAFWAAGSLLFFLRLLRSRRLFDHLAFGATAALAAATREGGVWLYVLAPLPLAVTYWIHADAVTRIGRLARVVFEWRAWLTFLVALALIEAVRGPTNPLLGIVDWGEPARGVMDAALDAMRMAAAGVTWPGLVAASLGTAWLLARRHWRALVLLPLVVPLWLRAGAPAETRPLGLLLPAMAVLALCAASPIHSVSAEGSRRRGARLTVLVLIGYLTLESVTLDLAMAADPRARAESWLEEQQGDARVPAFGRPDLLPRTVARFEWNRLEEAPCHLLDGLGARFLVVNRNDPTAPEELMRSLVGGELGYDVALLAAHRPVRRFGRGPLYDLERLDQELLVLKPAERPCLEPRNLAGVLGRLRETGEPRLREIVADMVWRQDLPRKARIGPGEAAAFGLRFDSWTYGTEPAALVVTNTAGRSAAPKLRLGCLAPAERLPLRAIVDDGESRTEVVFRNPGQQVVELPAVPAGGRRLFLVWAETSWQATGSDTRPLGVSVLALELEPES